MLRVAGMLTSHMPEIAQISIEFEVSTRGRVPIREVDIEFADPDSEDGVQCPTLIDWIPRKNAQVFGPWLQGLVNAYAQGEVDADHDIGAFELAPPFDWFQAEVRLRSDFTTVSFVGSPPSDSDSEGEGIKLGLYMQRISRIHREGRRNRRTPHTLGAVEEEDEA